MSQPHWNHTRTGRLVLAGLWVDASLVMAASAWNGGRALQALGDPLWAGVLLGLAVDVGLAVALIGDRALHLAGRTEHWGRALRITTALMSLGLNCAVAAALGQWGLVVFHAFLPLLLILLSEYAQASTLQFNAIADEWATAERTERETRLAADRAAYEAEQRRIKAERDRENERQDAIRRGKLRAAELADAAHQREMADRAEERRHRDRELYVSLASVTTLGAAWRRRPPTRPKRATAPIPRRSAVTRPRALPVPVPVTDELLSQARRLRTERASQGKSAGRMVLQRELGIAETTARELLRRLGDQPLSLVGSDR